MRMKIGMSQQQYQRIEAGNDMRISTLMRILQGMELELMLVPRHQVSLVEEMLEDSENLSQQPTPTFNEDKENKQSWSDLFHDLSDD